MTVYWLSEKLGVFAHEIEEKLNSTQLAEYMAYFKIKQKEEEKEMKKLKQKHGKKPMGRRHGRR